MFQAGVLGALDNFLSLLLIASQLVCASNLEYAHIYKNPKSWWSETASQLDRNRGCISTVRAINAADGCDSSHLA